MLETILMLLFLSIGYIYSKEKIKNNSGVYKNEKNGANVSKTVEQITQEAAKMAEQVKNFQDIDNLEEQLTAVENIYSDEEDEQKSMQLENECRVLQKAIEIANNQPYRYFYIDEPDTKTGLSELKLIGEALTSEQYNELNDEMKNKFAEVSFEDAGSFEAAKEMANEYLTYEVKELIKFREIIESTLSADEKAKKFHTLVSKSQYLLDVLDLDISADVKDYKNEFEDSLYGQYVTKLK